MQATRRKSRSHFDMFQEDDSELNVMDFVETEYKSDKVKGKMIIRKKSQRKIKSMLETSCKVNDNHDPKSVIVPSVRGKIAYKPKRKKKAQRSSDILPAEKLNKADVSLDYPYAACLKNLCDKAGSVQDSVPNLFPEKIFDTLKIVNVHYPYASLLEELHQNAEIEANSTPSTMEDLLQQDIGLRDFEIADVMRNLHYPIRNNDSRAFDSSGGENFASPFSSMLMAMVMQQRMQYYTNNQCREKLEPTFESLGVGEILKTQMPLMDELDSPPHELQTSALLQKLAFSAQQKVNVTKDRDLSSKKSTRELLLEWSSTESSQCEEDDLEWRPTHWLAKKVSNNVSTPRKRKSRRKTKEKDVTDEISLLNYPSASQDCVPAILPKYSNAHRNDETNPLCVTSPKASSRLLQLIIGCDEKDLSEKRKKKKVCKRSKLSKRRGKRKVVTKDQSSDPCWESRKHNRKGISNPTIQEHERANNLALGRHVELDQASEPQSLLKEYLLKPAGEEILPTKNSDIPKVETNFLFSRLLQNFKNLAESSHPDTLAEKGKEEGGSQSILRGMLVAGNSNAAELLGNSVREEEVEDDMSFTRSLGASSPVHHYHSHSPLYSSNSPMCKVKLEQDIKVECEEVFCKIECDEEVFECEVCYLQFSSGLDLSNHQILFHCTEDPLNTGGHKLVPCGVDSLQEGGAPQGKLHA